MESNQQQFWRGVAILLNNYHALNRKLFACSIINVKKVSEELQGIMESGEQHMEEIDKSLLILQLMQISKNREAFKNIKGFEIQFKCIPKKLDNTSKAVGYIDIINCSFRMIFEDAKITDFEIKLNDELEVGVLNKPNAFDIDENLRWCDFVLKPKFFKWCLNEDFSSASKLEKVYANKSLRLVDIEKYNRLYNLLKQKYSESAMKLWNDAKESTDPLKFIYEDLAIASYLITLWQSDLVNQPPTAFADLGCGNGLLVYILIQEGYQGYGYDVRSRKLWSLYPSNVASQLYEQVVEPFKFNLPAGVDWLIGNHSDELSPWLPVLAATCRRNINYFLLPCCAFEFSGNKFQRRNSSVSGYKNFCDYVENISNVCGFRTEKDRLKIPSTKRSAIIGLVHSCSDNNYLAKKLKIQEFVKNEQLQHPNSTLEEIKLRQKTEAVKNCTQIEKTIIESLVKDIFFLLLNSNSSKTYTVSDWETGRRLTMSEVAKCLGGDKLKQIKSECGGLKTLLRNKHEIFQFEQPDFVLIRKPQPQTDNAKRPQTIKKRACFFQLHHPQGCPLIDNECTFLH